MSADSVAQDQIKAFVDRILRMKEEAKAINADIREIYAEAKGNGFDKTVLGKLVGYVEKRNADSNAVAEGEALFDLYLTAYYGAGTVVATHTHAPEPQVAPRPAQADAQSVSSPSVENEGAAISTPIQPETAVQSAEPEKASAERGREEAKADLPALAPKYADPGVIKMENTPPEPVKWHPYANCFPTVLGDDLLALEKAIHERFGGVEKPIVKIGHLILDGRARYGIARSMQIDYPTVQYGGVDPLMDVIALNLASRNMTAPQRKETARRLAKLEPDRTDAIYAAMGVEMEVAA